MRLGRWGILVSVLAIALAFQNCSSGSSSGNGGSSEQRSGNGTGYGGKPTGKYYATNEAVQCTDPATQKITPIEAIIEVVEDGTVYYTEGCDESLRTPIDVDNLTITAANDSIFGYRDVGFNFERFDDLPVNLTKQQFIYASCYFMPLNIAPGGIVDINLVLRGSESTEHSTEIYYSVFSEDLTSEYARQEQPFNSTEAEVTPGYFTYTSASRPDFNLEAENPAIPSPMVGATLRVDLEGQSLVEEAMYCLYN